MAIFHLRSTIIQRSHGRSTLAAAAYRAGMKLEDRRQCLTFNYERRKHVAYREIYTPANAPEWMSEREELWNFVEAQEKRKDSQLAREFVLSLPHELTRNEQLQLLERYVRKEFVSRGLVVDLCIHENPTNVHAHLMTTMRRVNLDGFGAKCRELDGRDYLKHLRERWARTVNAFLMARGHDERIDHRSDAEVAATAINKPKLKQEKPMTKDTAPSGASSNSLSGAEQVGAPTPISSENTVETYGEELRDEMFHHLNEYFKELLARRFPGRRYGVTYDARTFSYTATVDGHPVLSMTRSKITCATGSDIEVELCVQAAIDFGWKRLRLNGTDDFKQRAFEEALRRGYKAEDIDGYKPQVITPSVQVPQAIPLTDSNAKPGSRWRR